MKTLTARLRKTDNLDQAPPLRDTDNMKTVNVKADLKNIADRLPDSASYADAMYELYVSMKVATGRQAAAEGRVVPHDKVKAKFAR